MERRFVFADDLRSEALSGPRIASLMALAAGALWFFASAAFAGGEHYRRLAVELAITQGDSRLLASAELSPSKRQWIEARISSAVNQLPLLGRRYLESLRAQDNHQGNQAGNQSGNQLINDFAALKTLAATPAALHEKTATLARTFPIKFAYALADTLDAQATAATADLFNQHCRACHATPADEQSVIIGAFSDFAAATPPTEWLARLLGGLHGDVYTRFENPFTDSEIAMLFAYTRMGAIDHVEAPPP